MSNVKEEAPLKASIKVVLGDSPQARGFKAMASQASGMPVEFVNVAPVHHAFKPMVQSRDFDVCEMAIVTYLLARAAGKPLVLLPAVMLGRFQHGCVAYNERLGILRPKDLEGRRVGVRSYSQTTGTWVRGILAKDYGVDLKRIEWLTFEGSHVSEYLDPDMVTRAQEGEDLVTMLLDGDVDAAILGKDMPADPRVRRLIPDFDEAARVWYGRSGVVPINHMVVVTEDLLNSNPKAVLDIYDKLLSSREAVRADSEGIDMSPFGVEANRPALEMIVDFAFEQDLIPRKYSVDELFGDAMLALLGT